MPLFCRGSRTGPTTESSPNSRRRRTSITRASGCVTRASRGGTPTRRSPSTASTRAMGLGAPRFPGSSSSHGTDGGRARVRPAVVGPRQRLPPRDQRQTVASPGPPIIPITFEVGVLFAALGAVFGMLGLNRLPMHHHPLFQSKVFERVTDDAFFISIESWDPRFDPSATGKLLESLGARSVELLES